MSAYIPYGVYWSTPFAKWQGSLANLNALPLAAAVGKQALVARGYDMAQIDLAILGAPAARFAEYTRQINAEYAWVPPEVYTVKRRAVLQGFLDREQIYTTPAVAQSLEQRARENLAKAISSL